MDSTVDELSAAYYALLTAVTSMMEARAAAREQERTEATNAAMEELLEYIELFKAKCDKAEELIDAAKTQFELEHMAEIGSDRLDGAIAEMKRDAVDP